MLLQVQNIILEMIAKGELLVATVERLCHEVEALVPGIICSVLTVKCGRLYPLAGPSLAAHYSSALDGLEIGPLVGSCGTAAYFEQAVTVTDIETDPRWYNFKDLIKPLGLKACWSTPIFSEQRVIATFAFYYRENRGPTHLEQEIVKACVHLCSIAVERHERVLERNRLAYVDALTGRHRYVNFSKRAILSMILILRGFQACDFAPHVRCGLA